VDWAKSTAGQIEMVDGTKNWKWLDHYYSTANGSILLKFGMQVHYGSMKWLIYGTLQVKSKTTDSVQIGN